MSLKEQSKGPWSDKLFCISRINEKISTILRPLSSCNRFGDLGVYGTLLSVSTRSWTSLKSFSFRGIFVIIASTFSLTYNDLVGVVISVSETISVGNKLIMAFWSVLLDILLATVLKK